VFNAESNELIEGVDRIDIYVNAFGRANAVIHFTEVNVDIIAESHNI